MSLRGYGEINPKELFLLVYGLCSSMGEGISGLQAGFLLWSHLSRCATLMRDLAFHIGVKDKEEMDKYFFSGLFHDIGKVCVAPEILNKNESLNVGEREEIEKHVSEDSIVQGFEEELGINAPSVPMYIYDCARKHHQLLDGTGYPQPINILEEFSPYLRALMVIDKFEAATSYLRPWQPKKDYFKIFLELQEGARDGKLDKEIVMSFFSYLFGDKINNLTCLPLVFKGLLDQNS